MLSEFRRQTHLPRLVALMLSGASLGMSLTACSDRTPTAISPDPAKLLAALKVSPGAITLAVNDTITLSPSAVTLDGTPVTNFGAGLTYTSLAATQVSVTPQGLVKGLASTDSPVGIVASLQLDSVTAVDTIQVYVTPTRAAGAVVFQPDPVDGTTIGINYYTDAPAFFVTSTNDTLYVPFTFTTSNPARAMVSYGYFHSAEFGRVVLYANANIYGTPFQDSIVYTITYASDESYSWSTDHWDYPTSLQLIVRPGATVEWYNYGTTASTAITFDDPSAVSPGLSGGIDNVGGNIPSFSGGQANRQFNTPGTYTWHAGTQTGKIIVQPTDMPPGTT